MAIDAGSVAQSRLREVALLLADEQGLQLVVLFGSAVERRGEPPEDLDIALQSRDGGALDLVLLTNRFIQLLGTQAIDLVDLRRADPLLMALVARDGVPLFEGEPGAFASFASRAARRYADTRKFRDAEREDIQDFVRRASRDA